MPNEQSYSIPSIRIAAIFTMLRCFFGARGDNSVIGGSAFSIAYNVDIGTTDFDTFESASQVKQIQSAYKKAKLKMGLQTALSDTPIATVPYHYADRVIRVLPELSNLKVFSLEKHDLALSKIDRGAEHDWQQLEQLHRIEILDYGILLKRYEEMYPLNTKRYRENFLVLIERIFGELKRIQANQLLKLPQ